MILVDIAILGAPCFIRTFELMQPAVSERTKGTCLLGTRWYNC